MSELISVALFLASIAIYSYNAGRNKFWFSMMIVLLALFIILNAVLYASNFFTGSGINDAVIYTLTNSLTGAGVSKYILPSVGLFAALVLLFCLLTWLLRRHNRPHHFGWSLLAILFAAGSVKTTPAFQQITDLVKSYSQHGNSDFSIWYQIPKKQIAHPQLNLVYIYAESLERTYFNQHTFPNLTEELSQQKEQGIDFSQTEQLPGTDYTIAGMVASQCGIPLFAPFEGNAASSLSSFYPQSLCLGDILKNSGYENWFIQGADLRFAGKDIFLQSHGFKPENMYGFQELKDKIANPSYRNHWGFYDDTVLNEVFNRYETLSRQQKRFALFTLTVDTHHPDGYISRSCQRNSYSYEGKTNQSLSAVACSQEHIARLIDRIKASPWFKNTIIVVGSDHLAMNNTAWKYLTKQPRHDLFFIIRGDRPQTQLITAPRSTLDNGATVLEMLGGDNFLGLGRSSLSGISLSATLPNLKQKIQKWKPDVIQLWNFPKKLDKFTIDQDKNTFSFSGTTLAMPILFRLAKNHIEPRPAAEYTTPLPYQLTDFAATDKFIWVDSCFKAARLWHPELALSTDLCMASGRLGGKVSVIRVPKKIWQGQVQIADSPIDRQQYQHILAQLKTSDNNIRYRADSFLFTIPGAPQNVESFSGLSRTESWGRWSNANLAPAVKITYAEPLPASFDLVITARAFGPNVHRSIPVQIGNQQQFLSLDKTVSTTTLHFTNQQKSREIVITPPDPQATNLDNIIGQMPRKLGIGLVEIKVISAP